MKNLKLRKKIHDCTVFGDKAYMGADAQTSLFDTAHTRIECPYRQNQRDWRLVFVPAAKAKFHQQVFAHSGISRNLGRFCNPVKHMRSAFLIIAHGKLDMLEYLIKKLDSPEGDIYIHIDAKDGDVDFKRFEGAAEFSKVTCLRDRVRVRWGEVSLIECTLRTIESALSVGGYRYLHLLSGVDFPLMAPAEINEFLRAHDGEEFIGFWHPSKRELEMIVGVYRFPALHRRIPGLWRLEMALATIQRILGIRRHSDVSAFRKGSNWWSITDDLAHALIAERDTIVSRYKWAFCPDEVFVQTFVAEHPEFMARVFDGDECSQGMRLID